mgnify:FL=1
MTKSEASPADDQAVRAIRARLSECLEGYVIVGFIAGSSTPIRIVMAHDAKTVMALSAMVAAATQIPLANET